MLIDIHAHLWTGAIENNKRDIIKATESYCISKVYISTLGSISGDGNFNPNEEDINFLNGKTAGFIKEKPDLIGGFCYVNPRHKNCVNVLRKGIEEQGMAGMKLWVATFCDDPLVFPLVEKCVDYKVPILVHTFHKAIEQLEFESVGSNVANLASRYPEAKIIMAHLGANCYREIKPIQHLHNVCVDISGSIIRRDDIDYTKKLIGANRILLGSDMPGASFLISYGQVEEADLTQEERELIYYKNALMLLDRS